MNTQLIICLVIFAATVVSYLLNKLPMWVTALTSMAALYITGCLNTDSALAGFSNSNTILMGSMFLLAAGFQRTSFVQNLCDAALKVAKGSFIKVYALYILLAVILTNLISSPVATYAVICPLLASLCDKTGTSRSKIMFPAMVVTVGCFGLLPLASAVQQSSQAQGFLTTYGFDLTITPMDFFFGKLPMLILLPLWAIFIGPKFTPENPVVPILSAANAQKKDQKALTPFQDKAAVIIFFGDILALVFAKQIGFEAWFIAFLGGLLMVLCGSMDGKTALRSIPWDMILLFVGSLALGNALTDTGAGEVVGNMLSNLVGGSTNNYVLGALFFIVPYLLTQVMQNRIVNLLFCPICLMTCQSMNANPIGLVLCVSAASLTAFLTPMATSAVPVCMSEGGYDLKALFKSGWLISILISVVYVFYIMTLYPAF